jgi:putative photosynthetic complex assembly protein
MSTGIIKGQASERPVIPRPLLIFMAGICLSTLAIVAFGRLTGIGVQYLPQAPVAEVRDLKFLDTERGVVEIRDVADNSLVRRLGPGEGGFIRTVMRGFAHDRMARGGDSSTSFALTRHTDGGLIMTDPVNGRQVLLGSFGKPNREVFAQLLKSSVAADQQTSPAAATDIKGDKK